MPDLLRLLLLILFLPVIIILMGPLLVLAVLRGQQQLGPITLDSSRYNVAGRVGMFLLGLAVWLLVWGGLVYLALEAYSPLSVSPPVADNSPTATPVSALAPPSAAPTDIPPVIATDTPPPTATPLPVITYQPTATLPAAIEPPTTSTATVPATTTTPAATASEAAMPASTPASTATPAPTITPTATTTPTATPPATPAPVAGSLSRAQQRAAVAAVKEANALLQQAIAQASSQNLNALERGWQGAALPAIKEFAIEVNSRYTEPFAVEMDYLSEPVVSENSIPTQIVVITQEQWNYGPPGESEQDNFEFIYTVVPQGDTWMVSRYTYRNLPAPQPTDRAAN